MDGQVFVLETSATEMLGDGQYTRNTVGGNGSLIHWN